MAGSSNQTKEFTHMPTRTGSFPIGFRSGTSLWQKDAKGLAHWARDTGFEAVDLVDGARAEMADAVKAQNLRLGSVDLLDFGQIMAIDPGKRRAILEKNLAYIKEAAAFGARLFFTVVIPGKHDARRADNYRDAVECYAPLAEAAAAAGAALVIEGWPGMSPWYSSLCCTPETVRQFLKDVPRGVAINYDPSHFIRLGVDHVRFLKEFAPHVKHVHAKDTLLYPEAMYEFGIYQPATFATPHRWGEQTWRYTIPGHGLARWGDIFAVLKDAGYQGAVSVELEDENFNPNGEEGEKAGLIHSLNFLRGA